MIVLGLKTCDTCRKAARVLAAAGHEVALRDIRAEPLSPEEIAAFLAAFGEALVNRRSTTWRALPEAARARPASELLAAHPALMRRPVIRTADGALHPGWEPGALARLA
ncbi:MAG: arsenate reductase [Alphaproteobacteria bacterium HGW-Alphaproteobacteria-2]|nr:MAG: arsenate reductase [Alphaproteobacteria bacterium HGW-Alphaproteobacteria-2]